MKVLANLVASTIKYIISSLCLGLALKISTSGSKIFKGHWSVIFSVFSAKLNFSSIMYALPYETFSLEQMNRLCLVFFYFDLSNRKVLVSQ